MSCMVHRCVRVLSGSGILKIRNQISLNSTNTQEGSLFYQPMMRKAEEEGGRGNKRGQKKRVGLG